MDDDRTPLDRVSIRTEVANERLRQMRERYGITPIRLPSRAAERESRSEREFALSTQSEEVPPPKPTTQPRRDGIQSGVFLWPLMAAVVALVLWSLL